MLLNQLGIYGWPERDENLLLASLLTGVPMLLIGNHGCAKTHVARRKKRSPTKWPNPFKLGEGREDRGSPQASGRVPALIVWLLSTRYQG